MKTPKVSVIIPNYNHGKYLRRRIDSILNQTFKDFEVIILDDCSSDTSREIIKSYAGNPSIRKIVFNDKNSGTPFKQWEYGISLALGEWIWLAESDDYADEKFLEVLLAALKVKKHVGLVYCDSKIVADNIVSSETFADIKNKKFATSRWKQNYTNNGIDEIENYLLPAGTINNSSAVLFNKKILTDVNPFDIPLRYIGDKYAFIKVLAHSDVVYVKEGLNYFRDPFNIKHLNKQVNYFYEQFLVYDWAVRNLKVSDKKKFYEGFYSNTRNSLFRDWNRLKLSVYRKLFRANNKLLLKSIVHNFLEAFRSQLWKNQNQRPPAKTASLTIQVLNYLHRKGFQKQLSSINMLAYRLKGFGKVHATYHPSFRAYENKVNGVVYLCLGPGWAYCFEYLKNLLHSTFGYYYTPGPGECVIDIGAGLGEETVIYALLVGEKGSVHSLEANPFTYDGLKYMCEQNRFTWVTPHHLAIYKNDGNVEIEDDRENYIANTIHEGHTGQSSQVKALTLDSFVKINGITRIDFLKSNIEGAEQFLILGMDDSVRIIRHLCISCHDFRHVYHQDGEFYMTMDKVKSFLEKKGFEITVRNTGNHAIDNYLYARNLDLP